jgi:hypothetical protein
MPLRPPRAPAVVAPVALPLAEAEAEAVRASRAAAAAD